MTAAVREFTIREQHRGTLAVLNVGAGDLRVEITEDAESNKKTLAMIEDMLRHGYALMAEIDGAWHRVTAVDPDTLEYIVTKPIRVSAKGLPAKLEAHDLTPPETHPDRKKKARETRAPMRDTRAVGVARSAGGCAHRTTAHMMAIAQRALSG